MDETIADVALGAAARGNHAADTVYITEVKICAGKKFETVGIVRFGKSSEALAAAFYRNVNLAFGGLCTQLGLENTAPQSLRLRKGGPIVDKEVLAALVHEADADSCRAHGFTVEDTTLVIWADVPTGATVSSGAGNSRGSRQQRASGSSSGGGGGGDGSMLSASSITRKLQQYWAKRTHTTLVYRVHNAETDTTQELTASSLEEVPELGTPGVELVWKKCRIKGQMLAPTCATTDEQWPDMDTCCAQIAFKMNSNKDISGWKEHFERTRKQQSREVLNSMMKEYDPDCEVGKCAPLGKAEEGADSWRAAFGNLYNARHQKDGSSSKLPAPLVRLHQLYYNRDSSAGQGTVSGSGGSVGSRQGRRFSQPPFPVIGGVERAAGAAAEAPGPDSGQEDAGMLLDVSAFAATQNDTGTQAGAAAGAEAGGDALTPSRRSARLARQQQQQQQQQQHYGDVAVASQKPLLFKLQADLNAAITRLEQVTARLLRFEATLSQGAAAAAAPAAVPAATANGAVPAAGSPAGELAAYDKLLAEQLQPFMSNATAVGGEVLEISKLVEKAFKEQRTVLLVASKAKQPDTAQLQSVLAPVAEPMMAASALADNRRSPCFQQNKVAAEALQALSWLAYTGPSCGLPLPAQHVAESWNAAEFFANKLLREFRGVSEAHVAWVQALKDLFSGLQKGHAGCAEVPAAGELVSAHASGGMQDVLKSLQQGASVTSGLRRVTDDMKAKNRADRSGAVPAAVSSAGGARQQPAAAAAPTKPPRLVLEQERKWVVEWQVGQKELLVTVIDPKQSVYIYNCSDCVVQVKGKCNAISIDKCKKTGVVFEDVIASCELVNCNSVQVQCTGTVPTVSVDKCDGVQAYLPHRLAANPNFQVVTAKSSEVNLLVLAANPDAEDVAEHPVPEQFISTFVNGKLVTTAASRGGG
ncbi:hypothetical protein OEZ86_014170 [Tetradesmus obliquus]|nr:hypothetical protein OEZ86_014170 [Tetradesmus obliquus]